MPTFLDPGQVVDKATFVRFVQALAQERAEAEGLERSDPVKYSMGGANDWQNGCISTFLEGALAGIDAQSNWGKGEVGPSWRELAVFLYLGKIYE